MNETTKTYRAAGLEWGGSFTVVSGVTFHEAVAAAVAFRAKHPEPLLHVINDDRADCGTSGLTEDERDAVLEAL